MSTCKACDALLSVKDLAADRLQELCRPCLRAADVFIAASEEDIKNGPLDWSKDDE